MNARATTYRVNPQVLLTELGDGTGVLLHLETKFYFTVNATSVALWRALERGASCTVPALARALSEGFEIEAREAEPDVARVVAEMLDEGLLLVEAG